MHSANYGKYTHAGDRAVVWATPAEKKGRNVTLSHCVVCFTEFWVY